MSRKVVITNFMVLKNKYGPTGVNRVNTALKAVIVADRARGLETSVVDLANAAAMRKVGGKKSRGATGHTHQEKKEEDQEQSLFHQ